MTVLFAEVDTTRSLEKAVISFAIDMNIIRFGRINVIDLDPPAVHTAYCLQANL